MRLELGLGLGPVMGLELKLRQGTWTGTETGTVTKNGTSTKNRAENMTETRVSLCLRPELQLRQGVRLGLAYVST